MSTSRLESHMMAIGKSNDGLSPPPKLLISHELPVLSGSNPQVVRNHPGSTSTLTPPPPPQKKRQFQTSHQHKKKTKTQRKMGEKKKKKRELSLRILPRRTRLLTSLYGKRLVRRGLQQQYLMRFSNLVKFIYARNIK